MKLIPFALPFIALTLVGCGKSDPPVIHMVSVSPAEIAAGGQVTLDVMVENFALRPPSDHGHGLLPAEEGHMHGEGEAGDYPDGGHFHVYMDSTDTNPLAVNCPDHCKHPGWMPSVKITVPDDATAGSHKIIVRLNDDDHKTLTPHIKAEAMLSVTSSTT